MCISDVDLNSITSSDTCCRCFLNVPENEDPPPVMDCRAAIEELRNQDSFTVHECCDNAYSTALHTYIPASSGGTGVCSIGYIFNNTDDFNPDLQQPEPDTSSHEYIIPFFTFHCEGCITELQILILGTTIPNQLTLHFHFWNKFKRARDDSNIYERNETFPLTMAPISVTQPSGNSLTSFVIDTPVCFESGDVFGFSLPLSVSVAVGLPGADGEVGYKVENPPNSMCALSDLFEPTDENSLYGLPQITLKIGKP